MAPVHCAYCSGRRRADLEVPRSVRIAPRHGSWVICWNAPSAELLDEREEVCHTPMLFDLAVVHTHRVHGLELNLLACWWNAKERTLVGPVVSFEGCDDLSVRSLPMDDSVEVGERLTKGLIQPSSTGLVRRHVGLRCMVEEVVREKLFEHIKISFTLDFLGISANDRFNRFARLAIAHGVLLQTVSSLKQFNSGKLKTKWEVQKVPRTYSNINKIRAELAWVTETPDPNKCGCRNFRCCEETGHKPGERVPALSPRSSGRFDGSTIVSPAVSTDGAEVSLAAI